MEWIVKFVFKLMLLAVAVLIAFSFVRQLFSPFEKPVVMAGPGGGRLPGPLPRAGVPPRPDPGRSANSAVVPPQSPPSPSAAGNSQGGPGAVVPVQVESPINTTTPITEATQDQISYRLLSARTQGNRLTIRLMVTNKGPDRLLEISSLPWSKTLFYNERSEVYRPEDVQIGNSRGNGGKTRAMLVSGVPAEIVLAYSELPMTVGSIAFRQIALMQLDVALFSTDQAYRNAFADPIAISRPTFRMIAITDGPVAAASGVSR
jgi:hypothetical protein